MSHYEERLAQDLERIQGRVKAVTETIEAAVASSVQALLARDRAQAARTILGDLAINREVRAIDQLCHAFIARHLPSAGHLRFVSSVLRLTVALERIGDYAVTIARETVQLTAAPSGGVERDIELLAEQAGSMLHQAAAAWVAGNAEMARGTKAMAGQVASAFDRVFVDLLEQGEAGQQPVRDLFALLVVLNHLERIADQAKNICEETVFATTGETKEPKVYRVLFVDRDNSFRSQLAAAIARKAFPHSGHYDSAGWAPAAAVDPRLVSFLDPRGIDLSAARPAQLDASRRGLAQYHVVVGLEGELWSQLGELPFRTVFLEWPPEEAADLSGDQALERLYRQLSLEIRDLMETLRGEGAT